MITWLFHSMNVPRWIFFTGMGAILKYDFEEARKAIRWAKARRKRVRPTKAIR